MHLEGSVVVKQDNETAMRYFEAAAEKKNPVGQSGLGLMYLQGKGVPKDYAKALKYFNLAAQQGWVDGQLQLGIMHLKGLGVPRDFKTAIKYFTMASQSGHVLGFYNLAEMHATGTGTMRSCSTAVELFKNVAERGPWGSGLMKAHSAYKEGKTAEAFVRYSFLAELGYEVAASNVAFMLDRHEVLGLFPADQVYPRAFTYWARSASQGYSVARVKLGDYYYYGLGTPGTRGVDYEMAADQYRQASDQQHNAQALFNLAYMHECGLGLKRDIHLAKRYYDLAAETSPDAQVPVALARLKLSVIFAMEQLKYDSLMGSLGGLFSYGSKLLGPDWDLYMMTIFAIALGLLVYVRRMPNP